MLYENQLVLDQQTHVLRAGREETLTFTVPSSLQDGGRALSPQDCRFKLQLKGDVRLHPYMLTESGITRMYQEITDALSTDACTERFSMKLSSKGEDFPRRAFYKLSWPPYEGGRSSAPDSWVLSARIKSEGLAVLPGGFVGLRLEEFRRREGRNPRDIGGEPDSVTLLPFPGGTRGWTEVQVPFAPHDDTVTLVLSIAMEHAEGTVWAEGPWLTGSSGFSVVVPFGMPAPYHPDYCWLGENLSKVERPRLRLTLNGHKLETDLFQRCHVGCENEIVLPDGWLRQGVNVLSLENITDSLVPMPYELRQTALVYGRKELRIVYAPEHPQANRPFGVLLWLEKPCTVRIHAGEGITGPDTVPFTEAGLQTLTLQAGAEGRGISLTVEANGETDTAVIRRIVDKAPDGVLTGSGDAVYIAQEPADMKEFFAWYMQNHLGNFITFRPVYRWSGSRSLRPETWQWLRKMCEALQEHYCLLIDGRELPGYNCNPPEALLKGDYYIGNQGHERDGALYYWQQRPQPYDEVFFQELCYRTLQHPDFDYKAPILYDGKKTYIYYNADAPKNMAEAADQLRSRFHQIMHDIHRHTGPSVLFKYFFQAGLEVGGAELMYGPQEVILSALRGASAAYDRPEFAAHLAVQWSTTPHDTPARLRRYRLALMTSYLHGCAHINTEEGFWWMEECYYDHNRFSKPCRDHADAQRDFTRFVETHSRTGQLQLTGALLHGVNDGWSCWVRRNVWGLNGEQWAFGLPEESWDLIRVFYPDSVLDSIYRHPCPDEPQGFYTRTPLGLVDILPAEAGSEVLDRYPFLAFMGFHTADRENLEKLLGWVSRGGSLLLGWCHLFTTVDRQEALRGESEVLDLSGLGITLHGFAETEGGFSLGDVELSDEVEVLQWQDGKPLLLRRRWGDGEVLLLNDSRYPAAEGLRPLYEEQLRLLGQRAAEEQYRKGWISGSDTVETAVYDREDGSRVIYAIDTDWWSDRETAEATLHLDGCEYTLPIVRDQITVLTIRDGAAVLTTEWETAAEDVHRCGDGVEVTVTADEPSVLTVLADGRIREVSVPAGKTTVRTALS